MKNKKGNADFMLIKDNKVKALYNSELNAFLTKISLGEDFYEEKLQCRYCNTTINEQNLYGIIPINDNFQVCCTLPSCISMLVSEAKHE